MISRNLLSLQLLLLAVSSSAFVLRPATFNRCVANQSPICSSLSDPDTDATAQAGDIVEEVVSTTSTDATSGNDENDDKAPRHTIYVGNLPYSATVQELRDMVGEYAEVRYVNLPRNRDTGNIKGFGFVDVSSEDEIPKVVDALNGKELEGRPLKVSRSLEKDQIRSTRNKIEGSKKLYVGNLAFDSTKEDLMEFFSSFCEVKDVFIPVDASGRPRGFAFVTVKEEDADTLIEAASGKELMGRTISVNHPLPPGERPQKRERVGRLKLFIGNLSFDTSGEVLEEVFSEFGKVLDFYIPVDPQTENPRGFAFLTMERSDGLNAIDGLDGFELDGRIISVNEAKPRNASPKEERKTGSRFRDDDDLDDSFGV